MSRNTALIILILVWCLMTFALFSCKMRESAPLHLKPGHIDFFVDSTGRIIKADTINGRHRDRDYAHAHWYDYKGFHEIACCDQAVPRLKGYERFDPIIKHSEINKPRKCKHIWVLKALDSILDENIPDYVWNDVPSLRSNINEEYELFIEDVPIVCLRCHKEKKQIRHIIHHSDERKYERKFDSLIDPCESDCYDLTVPSTPSLEVGRNPILPYDTKFN